MSDQATRDSIDRLLREDAQRPIPDDGFTQRVMGALPAAQARRSWLRPALILGSTALGCALAAALAPVGTLVLEGFADLARLHFTPAVTTALAMAVVLAISGYVLASEAD